jgi:hypothetical protein
VLAEVAALAADHGWAGVAEFTGAVPEPGDHGVTILAAAGADPYPLAAWIRELGRASEDGDGRGLVQA